MPAKRTPRRYSGTVRQLPSGKWQARGYDPAVDTQPTIGTYYTKTDAIEALREQEDEGSGETTPHVDASLSVSEWAARWLAEGGHLWKPSTLAFYRKNTKNHIIPRLGEYALQDVTRSVVIEWVEHLRGKNLSASSIKRCVATLQGIFSFANQYEVLVSNPTYKLRIGSTAKRETLFLTPEQIETLADAIGNPSIHYAGHGAVPNRADTTQYAVAIKLAAYTGLRAGEIWGLKWSNVDADNQRVIVTETLSELNGHLITGTPKNGKSRSVPVPATLFDMVTHIRLALQDDYVFHSPNGCPVRHTIFSARHFRPAVKQAGLTGLRFHDLRHTAASLMISTGAHPREVMARLGHSSINITMDRYGHLFPDADKPTTRALDKIFRQASGLSEAGKVVALRPE